MAVNPSPASVALVELVTDIVIANPDTELDGEFLAASLGIKSQKEVTAAVDVLRRVFDMQQAHSSGRRRIQKAGAVWAAYSKIHERDGVLYRCGVGRYVFDTDARVIKTGISKNKWPVRYSATAIQEPRLHVPDAVEGTRVRLADELAAPLASIRNGAPRFDPPFEDLELPDEVPHENDPGPLTPPRVDMLGQDGDVLVLRINGEIVTANVVARVPAA